MRELGSGGGPGRPDDLVTIGDLIQQAEKRVGKRKVDLETAIIDKKDKMKSKLEQMFNKSSKNAAQNAAAAAQTAAPGGAAQTAAPSGAAAGKRAPFKFAKKTAA